MSRQKQDQASRIKYQDEKIAYHEQMVDTYLEQATTTAPTEKNREELNRMVAYHKQLALYHGERKKALIRHA